MMNILHINPYQLNEIDQMLQATGFTSYTLDIWTGVENFNDYDVIAVGANENGTLHLSSNGNILEDLVIAHNNGVGVFFAHDCPQQDERYICPFDGVCSLINSDFMTNLEVFGVVGFENDFVYTLYTDIDLVNSEHSILNNPFDVHTLSSVQETHNNGVILSESCDIIAKRSGSSGLSNYHVAVYEDEYAKVVHFAGGHNYYGKGGPAPDLSECYLVCNMLCYCSKTAITTTSTTTSTSSSSSSFSSSSSSSLTTTTELP